MPSSITINKYNNEPFIRELTATATGIPNNTNRLYWIAPQGNIISVRSAINNQPYTLNTLGSALTASSLIITFSGDTYDPSVDTYSLSTFYLSCFNSSVVPETSAGISFLYDSYPQIDFLLGINFEKTYNETYFYRLTSTTPYYAEIKFTSEDIPLTTNLTTNYYDSWYNLNDTTTKLQDLSAFISIGFPRTTKSTTKIKATLSALSASNSLEPFWSPHVFERSLCAVFVPYFLSGDFIGWPKYYFSNIGNSLQLLTFDKTGPVYSLGPTNLVFSPPLEFYGEGHTETIYLSANNTSHVSQHLWRFNNSVTQYPYTNNNPALPLTSINLVLTSAPGDDYKIPVSLHLLNSDFLSTDPYFYFDDITGALTPYPYYIGTVDLDNNELSTNYSSKQSIFVKPYDPLQFAFNPGLQDKIYLSIDGTISRYEASLTSAASADETEPCFGKYGLLWKWSSFENCLTSNTLFSVPSTWSSTQCSIFTLDDNSNIITTTPGGFPKKWKSELPLSADLFEFNPINCFNSGGITWTLSADTGWSVTTGPISFTETYNYQLALKDFGITPFTTNFFNTTNLTLNAKRPVTCSIYRTSPPNDWLPRERLIDTSFNFESIAPPTLRLYTPNRYILTNSTVRFEHLTTRQELITKVTFDFDEDNIFTFTDINSIPSIFEIKYTKTGFKNVKVTANLTYTDIPLIVNFNRIVESVVKYDTVSVPNYRSTETPINIPWPEKPQVFSNDWVIEDNINSCFKKFFDNIEYLDQLGAVYSGTATEYFGYLSNLPVANVISNITKRCPTWTWEDVECTGIGENNPVLWEDVFISNDISEPTGRLADCGKWEQQECTFKQVNPICTEKYCIEWSWKQRKNKYTTLPLTWQQTRCNQPYKKKWYFEPCETSRGAITVCDEGVWNVNIPNLDFYYNTVVNPQPVSRCTYNGIASKNNILFLAQDTQIKLLSSDFTATYFDYRNTLDGITQFAKLVNICLDSKGKIYVLDKVLAQVVIFTYDTNVFGSPFKLFINWGGFGGVANNNKFSSPNDIHIDQFDTVWVADTGNYCIKHYSNTGAWLKTITDSNLVEQSPTSITVDSEGNLHVLTDNGIFVYSYTGEFLFSYDFKNYTTSTSPRRINTSYNREVIYIAFDNQVLKFFRNGIFMGSVLKDKENVNNITSVYQDEFRNLLITNNDKIFKYVDLMILLNLKGNLPSSYWQLKDILIHKEEYVQSWVYTKAFERMWDNIELFRNTLHFATGNCKSYNPPIHGKEKMVIGQNELVTAAVINRVLGYLWDNFKPLIDFFDPSCVN